jgi:rsbT co-antagonist protein RsbR
MAPAQPSRLSQILAKSRDDLSTAWMSQLTRSGTSDVRASVEDLRVQTQEFLRLLPAAARNGEFEPGRAGGKELCDFLVELSNSRARQGFTLEETATFVFSLKGPLFAKLREELGRDAEALAEEMWQASRLLDKLGLTTASAFMASREELIRRQQEDMLELSTPVLKLWNGVLALPMIGTLDSTRTAVVMEALLQRIVDTGSEIAIIDITGVPTVDTLVAQHLLQTVTAIRLMGAECILSGIRPQIAQTIVHLGVNLGEVTTKATLADAFLVALKCTGAPIVKKDRSKEKDANAERG